MKLPINEIICGAMPKATKGFPDDSINCCISSPPYWALRDYGVDGQLGLEKTFEEYIDKLCTIYDEVKRVLRKDGTCFVNLGDTYWGSGRGVDKKYGPGRDICPKGLENRAKGDGYLDKSLCLIPQRFAIEMVNRGWILRNVIIWHKPNPMPSSAKDRFTVDFEYVYFFVKNNQNLWYFRPDGKVSDRQPDYKSGIEGLDWYWGIRKKKKVKLSLWQGFKYWFEPQYEPHTLSSGGYQTRWRKGLPMRSLTSKSRGSKEHGQGLDDKVKFTGTRNKRTVWTIPTQPFPEAHFATFPEKLVEPMIKAGCPEFVCTKCGKAREKIYEFQGQTTTEVTKQKGHSEKRGGGGIKVVQNLDYAGGHGNNIRPAIFKGYTDCGCNADWRPGIVWDCFCWLWHDLTGGCKAAA